jgi:DNA processing protein
VLARDFAGALAEAGFVVVSGLARGIDGAAHRGALPATVGVIASGIDIAYPPEHRELQEQVAQQGLLIAEQPPGTEPRGSHFPSRNRIIAGMALGTLVVEAAPKSGSLITARLAGGAGREVMAIPGSPLEARSHGCNQLIRDGAVLVQTPDDVIELLQGFQGTPRSSFRETQPHYWVAADEDAAAGEPADVAGLLTTAPIGVDELVRQTGESAGAVQLALLELEIAGRLVRHAGGRVSLSA